MPSQTLTKVLPLFIRGKVVKGFGRGSKELGIPTGQYSTLYMIVFPVCNLLYRKNGWVVVLFIYVCLGKRMSVIPARVRCILMHVLWNVHSSPHGHRLNMGRFSFHINVSWFCNRIHASLAISHTIQLNYQKACVGVYIKPSRRVKGSSDTYVSPSKVHFSIILL